MKGAAYGNRADETSGFAAHLHERPYCCSALAYRALRKPRLRFIMRVK